MSTQLQLDTLPPVNAEPASSVGVIEGLAAASQPTVLHGAIDHWPILAAAKQGELDAYLLTRDRGAPVPVMEAPPASKGRFGYTAGCRDFSFAKRYRPLRETLNRIARVPDDGTAGTIAIQMLPLELHLPEVVHENPMPLVPPGAAPKLWLGGRVHTQIHNDRDHNLVCVIAGRRRFVLFPPEQVGNLYIGPVDNPPALSLVDAEAPDLAAFPRFREALGAAQVAYLGPGDALLIPRYWWHHVTSLDRSNAMVNYWWGNQATGIGDAYDAFLTALLAYKELPPVERAYWRAMIELHVFGDAGVSHLPPALRGPLGTLTPAIRAALKQRLKAAALKS